MTVPPTPPLFDPAPLVEAAKKATQGEWHTDRYKAYVWGENDEMIADRGGGDGAIRARGHGARLPVADNLDHIAAANPSAILAWAARDAEQVAEIERLRDEIEDLKQTPWPSWAAAVLAVIRKRSGYDGYDDNSDGVNLPDELDEVMAELERQAERHEHEVRADRKLAEAEHAAEHYRKQSVELRARIAALESRS